MKGTFIILLLIAQQYLCAQPVKPMLQKANGLYKQQQYEQAAKTYDQILSWDTANSIARFNRANAYYRLGKSDEAIHAYDELAFHDKDRRDKARDYYNKGVVLSNQKKLEESIEAYKNSLRLDPNAKDARENLQKALIELKKKTPPPPPKKEDKKKQQQNKKQQQQPKMNQKEAEQNLKLLEQKERELLKRMQSQKSKSSTGGKRDW
jgi:Ca-activated chloride channel family protein